MITNHVWILLNLKLELEAAHNLLTNFSSLICNYIFSWQKKQATHFSFSTYYLEISGSKQFSSQKNWESNLLQYRGLWSRRFQHLTLGDFTYPTQDWLWPGALSVTWIIIIFSWVHKLYLQFPTMGKLVLKRCLCSFTFYFCKIWSISLNYFYKKEIMIWNSQNWNSITSKKKVCILPACMCAYCRTQLANMLRITWYYHKWLHWHNFSWFNAAKLQHCWIHKSHNHFSSMLNLTCYKLLYRSKSVNYEGEWNKSVRFSLNHMERFTLLFVI